MAVMPRIVGRLQGALRPLANAWDGAFGLKGQTSHDGASLTARDVSSWRPPLRSADAEYLPERGTLVSRARDADRNNPIARSARQTHVDNVIGVGPMLMSDPDYAALGRDAAWAQDWAERMERRFHAWWWSWACSANDMQTGGQLCQLAVAALVMNGEALCLPLWLPDRGDGYATKLQMVEADRLSNPFGATDSQTRRGGIDYDPYGMPLQYWIRKTHPGDIGLPGFFALADDWEVVPRRTDFGRLRVIHLYDPERSPQARGKPLITTVLPELKNIDRYKRAEIEAAVANAMVAAVITTPLDRDSIVELFRGKDSADYLQARKDHAVGLSPGSLLALFPGDQLTGFTPARPAAQFGVFVENVLRIAACGLDLPYELLVKDFSKTTYTSGRMSLLEAWRSFNRRRDLIGTGFLDPIFGLFAEEQIYAGAIEAPGFEDPHLRNAYLRCQWIFPGRGWVDPVKEATGAALRLQNRLSTLAKECAEQGLYWRDVLRQQAAEIAFAQSLGLPSVPATSVRITTTEQGDQSAPAPGSPPAPDQGASAHHRIDVAA